MYIWYDPKQQVIYNKDGYWWRRWYLPTMKWWRNEND